MTYYCVEWDVKPYTLTHLLYLIRTVARIDLLPNSKLCYRRLTATAAAAAAAHNMLMTQAVVIALNQ